MSEDSALAFAPTTVAMNLAGAVEHPGLDSNPYLVDADGHPFVPIGDGGVVLGLHLGDSVFGLDTDHASPGVSVVTDAQPARHALTALSCLGNRVTVRSGDAAGARGVVLGKRGEAGRVLVWFDDATMDVLVPGDTMALRAFGQGSALPAALAGAGAVVLNVDPAFLAGLPIEIGADAVRVSVRGSISSALIGNGIGRPAHQWDLDVQVDEAGPADLGLARLALGDLLAVRNLDVRHNVGYRRGWTTVGVVVTTVSPRPGHGAGLVPLLCVPETMIDVVTDPESHVGVTVELLRAALA